MQRQGLKEVLDIFMVHLRRARKGRGKLPMTNGGRCRCGVWETREQRGFHTRKRLTFDGGLQPWLGLELAQRGVRLTVEVVFIEDEYELENMSIFKRRENLVAYLVLDAPQIPQVAVCQSPSIRKIRNGRFLVDTYLLV